MDDDGMIPLAQAVQSLRAQIVEALSYAEGEKVRFSMGPIECEFATVAVREADGKGGATFKILGWGVQGDAAVKASNQSTHKIKLTLTPVIVGSVADKPEESEILIKRKMR